ncbi:acrB [Candida pseudojiufengensis]|uniref:acrB n=1 Tax=Candida pseudojiufengensis TaxID=497109 RepID=UPI0022246996|nr:acrB [Candida pseudojiufengensis]KAI5960621.1 acrB [Candida pseudojiufengensis]
MQQSSTPSYNKKSGSISSNSSTSSSFHSSTTTMTSTVTPKHNKIPHQQQQHHQNHQQSQPTSYHHHYHLNGKNNANGQNSQHTQSQHENEEKASNGAVEHHHHYHHHHHHHSSPSSIFPTSSSLRDILSLVFITLSFPQSLSLVICILYLILGSNFMGGKFLINFLLPNEHKSVYKGFKKLSFSAIKITVFDSIIYLTLIKLIKRKNYFNYFIVLSKSIVASELIGSSSINYINSISTKKITTKIQYDDKNKMLFNNNLMNAIFSFIIINYINYLLNWFHFTNRSSTIANFIPVNNLSYINNINFKEYKIQIYLFLSIHIINQAFFLKKSTIISNSIPNISDEISVNVDENKLLDIEINLDNKKDTRNSSTSIAFKNFENFIVSPFNSKLTNLKNRMRASSITAKPIVLSKTASSTSTTSSITSTTSKSLTTTTIAPNVTIIENTIIIQPFWSIIAACKAILKNPNLFNGESSFQKQIIEEKPMAVLVIDSSKVILKFLTLIKGEITIKLNNIEWSYFKLINENDEQYLIIYGLTPLFQYDVEISEDKNLINQLLINTTGDNEIINKSLPETSSLITLQTSLNSSMSKLNNVKLKLKKFKKDENKKIQDIKNSIDVLKNKISKYNSNKPINENRVFGKIKGLKHSVIQLENEITNIQIEIENLQKEEMELESEFKLKQEQNENKIKDLEKIYQDYEIRLKDAKSNLNKIKQDQSQFDLKLNKLISKQSTKQEEIKSINSEFKNLKKQEILNKFSKRIKKINEKFDTIIPKIIHETEILNRECSNLINNDIDDDYVHV